MKKIKDMKWYYRLPIYWGIAFSIFFIALALTLGISSLILNNLSDTFDLMRTLEILTIASSGMGFIFGSLFALSKTNKLPLPRYSLTAKDLDDVGVFCPRCRYILNKLYCKRCDKHYKIVDL